MGLGGVGSGKKRIGPCRDQGSDGWLVGWGDCGGGRVGRPWLK